MSPVIHERKDGSQYILIGTGGETVDGELKISGTSDKLNTLRPISDTNVVINYYHSN